MQKINMKFETQEFRVREAFKTLRTNIMLSGVDIKSVCFTSCMPGDGKSTLALETARAFAEDGKRTLLIDADLRRSVLRARHHISNLEYGLTNYLTSQVHFADAVCATNEPNLFLLGTGPFPPNPSELLGSQKFANMMASIRNTFDMIIVDTPPLGSVVDTLLVAEHCDGSILVVSAEKTNYKTAKRVKAQLEKSKCPILGTILNRVNFNKGLYKRHYGSEYGKYYGEKTLKS